MSNETTSAIATMAATTTTAATPATVATPKARLPATTRPKISVTQLRILLDAIEKDPSMYNTKDSDMLAFLNVEKWINLTERLNETLCGENMTVASWKFILRFWGDSTKKRRKMCREKDLRNRMEKLQNRQEAEELLALEERLYTFMMREDAKEPTKVMLSGNLDLPPESNTDVVKFAIHLLTANERDENTPPSLGERGRKRTIFFREDNVTEDGVKVKKLKIFLNTNDRVSQHTVENQLGRLQTVSRGLEENISTIQNRIQLIREIWKHRCGDN